MWEYIIPIASALLQGDSAEDAADSQAAGTAAAIAEQQRQYNLNREDYAPWREAGGRALTTLEGELNRQPTAEEVMAQPGYQFGLQQGQQAIDRRIAAGGGRVSGAAIKAASRYGTDYATTGYNAEWTRRQDRLARLQSLAGLGQAATSGTAASGSNSANAISSLYGNQGDNAGNAALHRGNIWGNALNQVGAQYARNNRQDDSDYYRFFGAPNP